MKKDDTNSRVLLAIVVSFIFIIVYSYFVQDPEKAAQKRAQAAAKQSEQIVQGSSQTPESIESAPNFSASNSASATANSAAAANPFQANAANTRKIISRISSDSVEVEIDELGRIAQVYLKDKKFTAPKQEGIFTHIGRLFGIGGTKDKTAIEKLPLLSPNAITFPLEMRLADPKLNALAESTPYKASSAQISLAHDKNAEETLTLTQAMPNLTITKKIRFYYDDDGLKYAINISLSNPQAYALSSGVRPIADDDGYAFHGVVLKRDGLNGTIEKIEDKDAKAEGMDFKEVPFIAASDRYFTTLLFTRDVRGMQTQVVGDMKNNPIPYIMLDSDIELEGYVGPKNYRLLKEIYPPLTDVVEYGLITFFAKPVFLLLDYLYMLLGNWGWAIIGLTIIVRIILFPLSYKGIMSMQKLKDLTPKMKELQEQYKGDPQKLQMHMMQLYKKHGANPLGGCLPLLLQIPVFFAIYRVLYNAVELKSSEWIFWIHDLSVMDPYLVLPILMGASMYIQQALTPTTLDPMQAKIFKLLPVIFTIFLITFPAGLVLYWTINNIFAILMQLMINKIIDKKRAEEVAAHHKHETKKN
ncbi:membrane protein insertase YidC [Helicobacter sp. CLO-3]|uniref:membrane protein insertase YidC n=1 Tax=unclassified Helicobacter TaxID=2593540 RepID=UPI00080583E1|nr:MULTISPECIES: membrane protein insertase YidC [unclassified Helicobacter]OBV29916.1 membrane protein insertase YidC [Helicobacter sp. CLO-3]OHU81761.1 membrane protein insertase YidC [Helicobacter sp. CLO-3]